MKLTAELTLYPLQENYVPVISDFIDALNETTGLEIVTNAMSTQICGDHDRVVELVSRTLKRSYERHGRQVLVCKFIPWELALRT